MFHSDLDFDAPSGAALLAELGVHRETVREVVEDERAIRCPEPGAAWPAYGFASLAPEPPFEQGLHEAAPADLPGPSPLSALSVSDGAVIGLFDGHRSRLVG